MISATDYRERNHKRHGKDNFGGNRPNERHSKFGHDKNRHGSHKKRR